MNNGLRGVIAALLRLIVGVVGLVALKLIVDTLPMMRDLPLAVPTAISAVIMTGLIAIILWFGVDMQMRLPAVMPRFPDAGNMILSLAGLLAVIVAYYSYYGLLVPLLGQYGWIYSLSFLILALVALAALVVLGFISIEKLTRLSQGMPTQRAPASSGAAQWPVQSAVATARCPGCGQPYKEEDSFCASCGASLPAVKPAAPAATEIARETASAPRYCSKCGLQAKPGDDFCGNCGQKLPPSA